MIEFLSSSLTVILENADVFKPAVALQVLKPHRGQSQKLFYLWVGDVPYVPVVSRVFEQNLVRAHRSHPVVEAVTAAARGFALNMIKRLRMHDGPRRPRAAIQTGQIGNNFRRLGVRPAEAARARVRSIIDNIVARDHPRTGDGIFTEFLVP